jgi:RNA polymerase primary sigma factor
VRFVTYADWWIRKAILTAISDQIGPVRVPRYRQEQLRALGDARRRLRLRHGREPSVEATAREAGLEPEDLALLLGLGQRVVALDHPQHDDLGRPVAERLRCDENGGAQRALLDRDRRVRLRDLVSGLECRLREVVVLRFGLAGEPPATLREVGGRLGVSRERVRQIETRALAVLRRALQER